MLRVLLVFIAINVVYSQTICPAFSQFSSYPDIYGLQSDLTGTYLVVYTSATVVGCQRMNYVVDASNYTTGHVESPGCCSVVDDFAFNSNVLSYTIEAVSGYITSCPGLVTENGSMKLLTTIGSSTSLCLVVAICQSDYYGISVMCRGQAPLLIEVVDILLDVLGLLEMDEFLDLKSVSQTDCVFSSNNCPAF